MASKTNEVKEPKTAKKAVEKEAPKKKVAKPEAVEAEVKATASNAVASKAKVATSASNAAKANVASSLKVDVYGLDGKVAGTVTLPEEIFGVKVNKTLMAQAVRVYLANQRQGNASTKTRGEVDGSTRKIYRQKGTGRARHGSVRAPIFVKGGIVFGPKPRDFSLDLPKKMRRKALFSALAAKLHSGEVRVLSGLETIEPKTKQFVSAMKNLELAEKKLLLVMGEDVQTVKRAARNVQGVSFTAVKRLNAYDVLNAKHLVVLKDAVEEMKKHFLGGK